MTSNKCSEDSRMFCHFACCRCLCSCSHRHRSCAGRHSASSNGRRFGRRGCKCCERFCRQKVWKLAHENPFSLFPALFGADPQRRNVTLQAPKCIEPSAVLLCVALQFETFHCSARAREGVPRNVHTLQKVPAHIQPIFAGDGDCGRGGRGPREQH